jgi:hypothetical protein
MNVMMHCPQCALDRRRKVRVDNPVPISDPKRPVEWTCNRGHQNWTRIQSPFYELLYMRGVYDLRERDTRNAVLNFFGAYETFTATAVRLLSKALGVTTAMPHRTGPMLAVFSALFEVQAKMKAPQAIKGKPTGIRNEVAHGELVPSENQAVLVGDEVRRFVHETIKALTPLYQGESIASAVAAYKENPPKPRAPSITTFGFHVDFATPIRSYLAGHTASGRPFRPI